MKARALAALKGDKTDRIPVLQLVQGNASYIRKKLDLPPGNSADAQQVADFNRLMQIDACKEIWDIVLRSDSSWERPTQQTVAEILKKRRTPSWKELMDSAIDFKRRMDRLSQNDFLIGAWITGPFDKVCNHVLGLECFSYALADEPELLNELLQLEFAQALAEARAFAAAGIEFCFFHDDICDKNGPLIQPSFYEEKVFPFYGDFFDQCKTLGLSVMFISDGNITPMVPRVYACGCRGFFTLERRCGVDPAVVRSLAPDAVLAGAINSDIVVNGTPDDILHHVKSTVKALGWPQFMGTDGPLFEDIRFENMEALFAAYEENGRL